MKHPHYKKPVSGLEFVDVYRVLALFGVTDPCIQHACKKLLVTGNRGHKNTDHDIQDAIDTLQRWQGMRAEDERMNNVIRNGNTGEHYEELRELAEAAIDNGGRPNVCPALEAKCFGLSFDQAHDLAARIKSLDLIEFCVTDVRIDPVSGNSAKLQSVARVKVAP